MNCGYTCQTTPAYYTLTSGYGCGGYGTFTNNGWCTFLVIIFLLFIICGVAKVL